MSRKDDFSAIVSLTDDRGSLVKSHIEGPWVSVLIQLGTFDPSKISSVSIGHVIARSNT